MKKFISSILISSITLTMAPSIANAAVTTTATQTPDTQQLSISRDLLKIQLKIAEDLLKSIKGKSSKIIDNLKDLIEQARTIVEDARSTNEQIQVMIKKIKAAIDDFLNSNNNNPSDNTSNSSKVSDVDFNSFSGVFTIKNVSRSQVKTLKYYYDPDRRQNMVVMLNVAGKKFDQNTRWYSNQRVTINGHSFYRVSTNEWLPASDGLLTLK